jgi:hypothetical protein
MAWYQFDIKGDANAPTARECHSLNAIGTNLVMFGGNDSNSRMNEVHSLDTRESRTRAGVEVDQEPPPARRRGAGRRRRGGGAARERGSGPSEAPFRPRATNSGAALSGRAPRGSGAPSIAAVPARRGSPGATGPVRPAPKRSRPSPRPAREREAGNAVASSLPLSPHSPFLSPPPPAVTMKWTRIPPEGDAPVKRSAHSSALVDGRYMFVFGGWDGNTELGDLTVFDFEKRR